MPDPVRLVVARVGRAHGLAGEVTLDVRTDDPDRRLAAGSSLLSDRGPLTVATVRWHSGRLLARFEGCGDRTAAEALRGTVLEVEVPADERPEDPEEFYDHQLVGCSAVLPSGTHLGEVTAVLHLPGQDLLAVGTAEHGEVLVPFVAAFVPEVDVARRRLVVDPPPGLLGDAEA